MEKGTFVLKKPSSNEETLIYLIVRFNYKKIKISTELKIFPKFWNAKKQVAREVDYPFYNHSSINERLKKIKNAANDSYDAIIKYKKDITPDDFKKEYNKLFYGIDEDKKDLISYTENLILNRKEGKEFNDNKRYSKITVRGYQTTLNHLKEFSKAKSYRIDFDTINMAFYNTFIAYFYKKDKAANTVGKHIKNIKVILRKAKEEGIAVCEDFLRSDFKTLQEDTTQIYLNDTELNILFTLDLSKNKRLATIRDQFLIAAYTGLRFADLYKLNKEHIISSDSDMKKYIKINTQKTGKYVVIPCHRILDSTLKKYDYIPPPVISNQKFNLHLKKLCDVAEFHDTVQMKKTIGGKTKITSFKKFELVTAHTARRSMATNMFKAGIPTISIMKITGHTTEKSFLKYIRISEEENAELLSNHEYFK